MPHDLHFHCLTGASSPYTRVDTHLRGTGVAPGLTFYSLTKDLNDLVTRAGGSAAVSPLQMGGAGAPRSATPGPAGGRPLLCFRMGTGPARALIVGGQHADEWVGVSLAYWLAEWLVDNMSTPLGQEVLHACSFYVVPMANPDGHEYAVTTERRWRKNSPAGDPRYVPGPGAAGTGPLPGAPESVDVNRNFSTDQRSAVVTAGVGSFSTSPGDDTYMGASADSSFEATMLGGLIRGVGFDVVFDFHANGCFVLHPPADDARAMATLDAAAWARYENFLLNMKWMIQQHAYINHTTQTSGDVWTTIQAPRYYNAANPAAARVPGSMCDHAFYAYPRLPAAIKPPNRTLAIALELPPARYAGSPGHMPDESILRAVHRTCVGAVLGVCRYIREPSVTWTGQFDRFWPIT